MARYLRRFSRIGHSLGPSEERGFAMWVGYDIVGVDGDLSPLGYINVEGWSEEQLAPYDVVTFMEIEPEKLGIERKR
ncbi:MAG TPA: hypothetical protein VGR02_12185 [Thermoanaerobaculia bacterium]|jgi:hypothetical protein|nr:hypothetical protein [Thermoanaerobaculia bacterium]